MMSASLTPALLSLLLIVHGTAYSQPAGQSAGEGEPALADETESEDLDISEPADADGPTDAAAAQVVDGPIVAIALSHTSSVDSAFLIGDGGRVYQYDSTAAAISPRWVRKVAGGMSAKVAAATRNTEAAFVIGSKAPVFRWRDNQWLATPLAKGNIVVGGGPVMSLAVGRLIYTWEKGKFTRKAFAPANVTGLWVGSDTNMRLSTDRGLFRRGAKLFVPIRTGRKQLTPGAIIGARPTLVAGNQLVDIDTLQSAKLPGKAVLAASSAAGIAVVTGDRDQYKVAFVSAKGIVALPALPSISGGAGAAPRSHRPRALAVASNGDVLLATDAAMLLYRNKAWRTITLATALPRPKPGPGPALTR